jgi:formyltetrahydrofolate-dependent phosphoribosylglycinamide formyltransferase
MINLAVFVSGRGSNLRALVNRFKQIENAPRIKYVISDKSNCPALEFAEENGIETLSVSSKSSHKHILYDELVQILNDNEISLIVLAGFLKKIPDSFIDNFKGKIVNIHPALLPKFGGKGMYGMNVHRAVFESKSEFSGATVHYVDKIYDHGEIIEQISVPVAGMKSPREIADAVLEVEHDLLPKAVLKVAEKFIKKRKSIEEKICTN